MLMPILTVKAAAAPTAHAAAVVETATPKDRTPTLPPIRISGRQSEVMLKILETLNRHLVGSEPLPREALVRLLDTLAKVLKFPPLPQESLRDFSKRLAVFLETLPPAVRQAVEKQLGQRNLAVSIRILTEALKMPSLLDAPRLPDRAFTPLTPGRPLLAQPETPPVTTLPAQQQPPQQINQSRPAGQQQTPSATQTLPMAQGMPHAVSNPALAAAAFVPDPGILQAALKKAFGDDDEAISLPVIAAEEYANEHDAIPAVSREDDATKPQTPRSGDATATGTSARMPAKANAETIPLLRAAAAFLAADPEALSQVSAIASGDIDSRVMTAVEEELEFDLSTPTEVIDLAALPDQMELPEPSELPDDQDSLELMPQPHESEERPAARATTEIRTDRPAEALKERPATTFTTDVATRQNTTPPQNEPQPAALSIAKPEPVPQSAVVQVGQTVAHDDVTGFTGHDLGEWELEYESTAQPPVEAEEVQQDRFEPGEDEKVFSQTLKALVEASLPLPEGSADWNAPEALFSALAGETADMEAEVLFAELEAADEAAILPDTTLFTGDIGDTAETSAFDADILSTLLETPEDGSTTRSTFSQSHPTDEPARDAQPQRQPETIVVARDAIPFAMIPYLPAKIEGMKSVKEEEDEQPYSTGQDEHQQGENHEARDEQERESGSESSMGAADDGTEAGDAYDLYRRMGGLG